MIDIAALARRAVACKGWRWMAGMLTHDGYRMIWCSETEREWAGPSFSEAGMAWRYARIHGESSLPDLTDPATLGCLLALVREAWGQPELFCSRSIGLGWGVYDFIDDVGLGHTEAEALVAALEAAP